MREPYGACCPSVEKVQRYQRRKQVNKFAICANIHSASQEKLWRGVGILTIWLEGGGKKATCDFTVLK